MRASPHHAHANTRAASAYIQSHPDRTLEMHHAARQLLLAEPCASMPQKRVDGHSWLLLLRWVQAHQWSAQSRHQLTLDLAPS